MKGGRQLLDLRRLQWMVALLLPAACLTPVDIEVDNKKFGELIAISGQISTQEERSFVEIGIAVESNTKPLPVSEAKVIVSDQYLNIFEFIEDPLFPGKYIYGGTAVTGGQYQLEVTLPDGRVFRSAAETVQPPAAPDLISQEFKLVDIVDFEGAFVTEPRIEISTKPDLTGSARPLVKWYVEETYLIRPTNFPDPFGVQPPDCFVRQGADPQRVVLFDGREYSGAFPEPLLLATRKVDQSFFYRHYFSVYQASLTPEAFDYWNKVNILTSQTGSIFDVPPARITGNISQAGKPNAKAFGYFQAVGENLSRFYVLQTDLPDYSFLPTYCDYDPYRFSDYPAECLDCLSVRNSTLRRPWWF